MFMGHGSLKKIFINGFYKGLGPIAYKTKSSQWKQLLPYKLYGGLSSARLYTFQINDYKGEMLFQLMLLNTWLFLCSS